MLGTSQWSLAYHHLWWSASWVVIHFIFLFWILSREHKRGEFLSALRSLLVGSHIVKKGAIDSQKSWNASSFYRLATRSRVTERGYQERFVISAMHILRTESGCFRFCMEARAYEKASHWRAVQTNSGFFPSFLTSVTLWSIIKTWRFTALLGLKQISKAKEIYAC